jgi:uncharacterized protein
MIEIEPYNFLNDITLPIELQHGTNDKSVPIELSRSLKNALETAKKDAVYFEYIDDHNISINAGVAWKKTIAFFKKHL